MIASPCKDCPDRHPACWGECERYKEYREKIGKLNKEEHRQHDRYVQSQRAMWMAHKMWAGGKK